MPVFSECDILSEWSKFPDTATLEVDTAVFAPENSSASIKLTIPTNAPWATVAKWIAAENWSAYPILTLWVRKTTDGAIAVNVITDNADGSNTIEHMYTRSLPANTWTKVTIDTRVATDSVVSGTTTVFQDVPNMVKLRAIRVDYSILNVGGTLNVDRVMLDPATTPPPNGNVLLPVLAVVAVGLVGAYLVFK